MGWSCLLVGWSCLLFGWCLSTGAHASSCSSSSGTISAQPVWQLAPSRDPTWSTAMPQPAARAPPGRPPAAGLPVPKAYGTGPATPCKATPPWPWPAPMARAGAAPPAHSARSGRGSSNPPTLAGPGADTPDRPRPLRDPCAPRPVGSSIPRYSRPTRSSRAVAGSEAGDRDPHDSMAGPLLKAAEARPDEEELHRGTSSPASGGDARPDEEELHRGTSSPASGGDARPDEEELRRGTSSPASGGDTQAHHVAQEEDAQGDPFPMDSVPDDSGAPDPGAAADDDWSALHQSESSMHQAAEGAVGTRLTVAAPQIRWAPVHRDYQPEVQRPVAPDCVSLLNVEPSDFAAERCAHCEGAAQGESPAVRRASPGKNLSTSSPPSRSSRRGWSGWTRRGFARLGSSLARRS